MFNILALPWHVNFRVDECKVSIAERSLPLSTCRTIGSFTLFPKRTMWYYKLACSNLSVRACGLARLCTAAQSPGPAKETRLTVTVSLA